MGKRTKSENKEENVSEIKKPNLNGPVLDIKHDSPENKEDSVQQRISGNEEITSNTEDKTLRKKKGPKKPNKPLSNNVTQNKKIIFNDDNEAQEVPLKVPKKKNKKVVEPPEEEPTEEDIDQFCAEINEEDNVEYENWVKLIEAKLSSNKKKT
ncbi:hypothetical protein KGM_209739 [Danaus plexippus plexippus]|uniref:Uncharacterized protein n=1 Tax=Danaus plexippus plexippus TaxID=278856 RepID=A0A212FPG7_DANPL|nr:uncharacterized protein LOC116771110 [Danaus plexippus plexippus]XP_032518714.1 uncharacterized protein LOC116771110 [Danaus plexippus plexippus]XP_032518715.1 uncharacterized protein LOC116771110 [Danaus plexippus plexippus]OWR55636.1 hypothetical protein KGM_209739 [Danaus plexippus plexippus]